jgi:hypothetical protein
MALPMAAASLVSGSLEAVTVVPLVVLVEDRRQKMCVVPRGACLQYMTRAGHRQENVGYEKPRHIPRGKQYDF